MAAPGCASPVELCAIRATRLNADGTPADGPDNVVIPQDPISLQWTPNIREGDEHELIGGCGGCVIASKTDEDTLRRIDIEIQMGRLIPAVMEMLIDATVIEDTDGPLGFKYGAKRPCGTPQNRVMLEAWSKRWTEDDEQDPDWPWWHFLFSSVASVPAQQSLQSDFGPVTINGKTRVNSSWGFGPYFDAPVSLGTDHMAVWATDEELPTASCDYSTIAT